MNNKWNELRQWLEEAVEEGRRLGYNSYGTPEYRAFYAYENTLRQMRGLEMKYNPPATDDPSVRWCTPDGTNCKDCAIRECTERKEW